MLKKDVKIGGRYRAKIGDRVTTVRIDRADDRFGGWHAVNEETGRQVRIKSAQKLRSEVTS